MSSPLPDLRNAALVVAAALVASLGTVGWLFHAGSQALAQAQDARLQAAGSVGGLWLAENEPTRERLRALLDANALDGAYVVDPVRGILADATGSPRARVDLLRTDPSKVREALSGHSVVTASYTFGLLEVATGYFPFGHAGATRRVLALEIGRTFEGPRRVLLGAGVLGALVSIGSSVSLGGLVWRWNRAQRLRREEAMRGAHGAAVAQMAAMAAHEFRNPLGVVRGTVELFLTRAGTNLRPREREDLESILSEVSRMRVLTDDFLELSADRSLRFADVELGALLSDAALATESQFPAIRVRREWPSELPAFQGDPGRLRQVFANLLTNAAQAQSEGEILLRAAVEGSMVAVAIRDQGPGIPESLRTRLFDPFVTGKTDGTGLGLALSKRLVERHGGALRLVDAGAFGTTFEVRLPLENA